MIGVIIGAYEAGRSDRLNGRKKRPGGSVYYRLGWREARLDQLSLFNQAKGRRIVRERRS